jgi:hypothetical protein
MKALMLVAAGTLAFAPLAMAQDHAVPSGGGGGGHSGGGGHPSASSGGSSSSGSSYSGGSSSSSSSSGYSSPSTAESRHPRGGTGQGGYSGRGEGHGRGSYYGGSYSYYPSWYGSYWSPYGSYGWYGGYWGGSWGYPWAGGSVYHYVRREAGAIRVLVDPAEARVYVDGYYAGVVDDYDGLFQRLSVSPGRHEITLKLEGYKTHRMKVYVGSDSTLKLRYDLQKGSGETFEDLAGNSVPERELRRERARDEERGDARTEEEDDEPALGGRLKLRVRPTDSSIYIDGAFKGSAREIPSLGLPSGRHRVEVVRPGYRTAEKDVEIEAGETNELSIELDETSL